ncbi:MAG TPA: YncE family protein [Micropepsaceae bacterium]|nr:YncE family protein [Micropepsaceae bacterium]
MIRFPTYVVALCLAAFASIDVSAADNPLAYHVTKSVTLGSPEQWDYLVYNSATHDVYVSHGDRVSVVDGYDGRIVGTVEGFTPGGPHGVAIVPIMGKGYTTDRAAKMAVAFDLNSLKIVKHIPVDEDADAVAFDPVTGHVFVIDGEVSKITVIDPRTDSVVATIDAGIGKFEYAAGGGGKLYVNGADKREIIRIDAASNRIDAHWPVPDCASPHGMALDPEAHRLFTSCTNERIVVLDMDTGRLVATLPIGRGTDAVGFDPLRKRVYSSNGVSGTLSVIQEQDADHFAALGDIGTVLTARTMAVDPQTGRIFLAAADLDPAAPPPTNGRNLKTIPGSFKLLFLDPP